MTEKLNRNSAAEGMEPTKKSRRLLWFFLMAALFGVMFLLYYYQALSIGPLQPISFSHRIHAGVKQINCRFCHPNVERSQNAGLPAIEKCFFCHKYVIPDHPEIKREEQYLNTGTPVPWKRIFWVPDFVFFNHIPHLKWGKLDCVNCHGDVKTFDRLERKKFKMNFCITCHRKRGAQLDCWLACHR